MEFIEKSLLSYSLSFHLNNYTRYLFDRTRYFSLAMLKSSIYILLPY